MPLSSKHDPHSIKASEPPPIENLSLKNTPKSDHKSPTETELDLLESKLRTVQLALEILTGTCATLPDPEPLPESKAEGDDIEVEEGDDDGEYIRFLCSGRFAKLLHAEDDNTSLDVDMATDDIPAAPNSTTHLPSLVPPLLTLINPTSLSFPPLAAQSPHPPTTSVLSAIHISALECLNNIFLSISASVDPSVSADKDGGRKVWNDIWSALGVVGTETGLGQERRQEMWEIAVGVLWGIGNIWKGSLVSVVDRWCFCFYIDVYDLRYLMKNRSSS